MKTIFGFHNQILDPCICRHHHIHFEIRSSKVQKCFQRFRKSKIIDPHSFCKARFWFARFLKYRPEAWSREFLALANNGVKKKRLTMWGSLPPATSERSLVNFKFPGPSLLFWRSALFLDGLLSRYFEVFLDPDPGSFVFV